MTADADYALNGIYYGDTTIGLFSTQTPVFVSSIWDDGATEITELYGNNFQAITGELMVFVAAAKQNRVSHRQRNPRLNRLGTALT
jgi:hypothetical protein